MSSILEWMEDAPNQGNRPDGPTISSAAEFRFHILHDTVEALLHDRLSFFAGSDCCIAQDTVMNMYVNCLSS